MFKPKVRVALEKNNFRVCTIADPSQLDGVLRLRYDVFHREYRNRHFPFGLDVERFDLAADHLVIIDNQTNRIVGTYRLLCTLTATEFYSASEFTIDNFLRLPGVKLEMSRACIHRDYRKGVVMNLLWRGLMDYVRQVDARFLFGCSSVKTMDPNAVALVVSHLSEKGHVRSDWETRPLSAFQMEVPPISPKESDIDAVARALVPPLLNSYLRAGAKIAPAPALDREFQCVDFFTVLDLQDLTKLYERKYA